MGAEPAFNLLLGQGESPCEPGTRQVHEKGLGDADENSVRVVLPCGSLVFGRKDLLAQRASFFAPFAEEPGPASFGNEEIGHLLNALAPGAQQALPAVLQYLAQPLECAKLCSELFDQCGLLNVFAVAHLLGATQLMDAAREWASTGQGHRLAEALAKVDAKVDAAAVRTAAAYGLDRACPMRLLHAAAEADAVGAAMVLAAEVEAEGSIETTSPPDGPPSLVAPIDQRDAQGRTALHVCAIRDSAGVAAVLLKAGADLEALCDSAELAAEEDCMQTEEDAHNAACKAPPKIRTALHLAALHDSPEVAQLLLDARANVAACVKGVPGALTPLHECAAEDAVRVARILAPVAAAAAITVEPAEPTQVGDAQPSPVLPVFESTLPEKEEAGSPDKMDVDEDADMVAEMWCKFLDPLHAKVGHNSSTPLHMTAECDAPGVASVLLASKADPNMGDAQGDTALHCALLYGSPRVLAVLLNGGGDPCKENGSGELPLHLMAEFGLGAETELPEGLARRHFARSMKAQELLVDELKKRGHLDRAKAHAAAGDNGNTPLHAVARWDHLGAVNAARLLLGAKADVEAKNDEGRTPLAIALRRYGRDGKVVALLREHGAKEPPAGTEDPFAGALGGCVRPLLPPRAFGPP